MRSDERRLKLSSCIVRSRINATIQEFHRDEEMPGGGNAHVKRVGGLLIIHFIKLLRKHGIIEILIYSSFIEIN